MTTAVETKQNKKHDLYYIPKIFKESFQVIHLRFCIVKNSLWKRYHKGKINDKSNKTVKQ